MDTIHENSIPFVFRNIFIDEMSGTLEIKAPDVEMKLFFENGVLLFATTTKEGDRLGELLIKTGKIVPDKLSEIEKQASQSNEKIGILLVKNSYINQKELYRILVLQMNRIASTAFFIRKGHYNFNPEVPELQADSRFSINLGKIIKQNCAQITLPELFRDNFNSMIPQPGRLSASSQKLVEQEDLALAREISTLNHMHAADIPQYLNIGDKIYWNRLYFFYLINLITFREPELAIDEDTVITRSEEEPEVEVEQETVVSEPEESEEVRRLNELHDNLKSGKLNYYQYLGLDDKASKEVIREAYFKMAKQFHPDKVSSEGEDMMEKANFVFTSINRAYEVLSNQDQKSEYDAAGQKDANSPVEDDSPPAEKASNAYKSAQTFYKKNELVKACALLEEAVKNDSEKGNYHYMLGLCQASISLKRRDAEKSFLKAAELNPWDSKPLIALAKFFVQEGLKSRAVHYLQQAQQIDPENKGIVRMYEELTGKKKKGAGNVPFGWLFGKKK